MKYIVALLIAIFFIGCGDEEDRVVSGGIAQDASVVVPLRVGESRSFDLNLDTENSYLVTCKSQDESKKASCRADYLQRTYPEIIIDGVEVGSEYFVITAEDASGAIQTAVIRADVNATDMNLTIIDIATGDQNGSVIVDPNDPNNGGGTTPPPITPTQDPNACLDNDGTWGKVGDSWGTAEGMFSQPDLHYWIRSQIPEEPSSVMLYYKKVSTTSTTGYLSLGRYSYSLSTGKVMQFDMQVLNALLGLSANKYFYIKYGSDCFRGELPASPLMPPNKTLTPVFTGSLF